MMDVTGALLHKMLPSTNRSTIELQPDDGQMFEPAKGAFTDEWVVRGGCRKLREIQGGGTCG